MQKYQNTNHDLHRSAVGAPPLMGVGQSLAYRKIKGDPAAEAQATPVDV
jgi:hypothetical protein